MKKYNIKQCSKAFTLAEVPEAHQHTKSLSKAFTLAELLIALSVVGLVAVLTVPNITKNIFASANVKKFQATYNILSDSIKLMMLDERITDISESSLYNDPAIFYNKYLKVISDCSILSDCIVPYKPIDKSSVLEDISYIPGFRVMLPSGAVVEYNKKYLCSVMGSGHFQIDVNGIDAPNVLGKDVFPLELSNNGKVGIDKGCLMSESAINCRKGVYNGLACTRLLMQNNWEVKY